MQKGPGGLNGICWDKWDFRDEAVCCLGFAPGIEAESPQTRTGLGWEMGFLCAARTWSGKPGPRGARWGFGLVDPLCPSGGALKIYGLFSPSKLGRL